MSKKNTREAKQARRAAKNPQTPSQERPYVGSTARSFLLTSQYDALVERGKKIAKMTPQEAYTTMTQMRPVVAYSSFHGDRLYLTHIQPSTGIAFGLMVNTTDGWNPSFNDSVGPFSLDELFTIRFSVFSGVYEGTSGMFFFERQFGSTLSLTLTELWNKK